MGVKGKEVESWLSAPHLSGSMFVPPKPYIPTPRWQSNARTAQHYTQNHGAMFSIQTHLVHDVAQTATGWSPGEPPGAGAETGILLASCGGATGSFQTGRQTVFSLQDGSPVTGPLHTREGDADAFTSRQQEACRGHLRAGG